MAPRPHGGYAFLLAPQESGCGESSLSRCGGAASNMTGAVDTRAKAVRAAQGAEVNDGIARLRLRHGGTPRASCLPQWKSKSFSYVPPP